MSPLQVDEVIPALLVSGKESAPQLERGGRGFTSSFIVTAGYVTGVVALSTRGQNYCGLILNNQAS